MSTAHDARVRVEVTTTVVDQDHVLALDIPRGHWSLPDLHELARTTAEAAGILGDHTGAVSISVTFPD